MECILYYFQTCFRYFHYVHNKNTFFWQGGGGGGEALPQTLTTALPAYFGMPIA